MNIGAGHYYSPEELRSPSQCISLSLKHGMLNVFQYLPQPSKCVTYNYMQTTFKA